MPAIIRANVAEVRETLQQVRDVCHTAPILADQLREAVDVVVRHYAAELDARVADALIRLEAIEKRLDVLADAPDKEVV